MKPSRIPFLKAWQLFKTVNVPVAAVGEIIGGNVKKNIGPDGFKNACPIRMSYVLNYSGIAIPSGGQYAVVSGADKKWYMYRVNDMMAFLSKHFGPPDLTIAANTMSKLHGKTGILLVQGNGWRDARGHVTLWNGTTCSDTCHLFGDPNNGNFVPERVSLWILK